MEQRCKGTMAVWGEPFTALRVAKLFNLRTDPCLGEGGELLVAESLRPTAL